MALEPKRKLAGHAGRVRARQQAAQQKQAAETALTEAQRGLAVHEAELHSLQASIADVKVCTPPCSTH